MIENKKYIQFEKLNEVSEIIHLFTKRPFNFSKITSTEEKIKEEYQEIEDIFHYKFTTIKKPIQTHTNIVKVVNENNIENDFQDVDGLITNMKGVALVTSLADCQGILLYDPKNKVIGNIHSGWKGTLNKIVGNAVSIMEQEFHCNPQDIEAFICPSILKCCFEVDKDVVEMFQENFDDINEFVFEGEIKEGKQKYFIDTIGINKRYLQSLGLKKEHITSSDICTKCNASQYHSYRVDHEKSGRNIALICIK